MKNSISTQTAKYLHERRGTGRWRTAVCCLALIVVCATAWALLQKGHAMAGSKGELYCQFETHVHSEECYTDGKRTCGKTEYVIHTHDDNCYDVEGELVCQMPEENGHIHDSACFEMERTLVCGITDAALVSGGEGNPAEVTGEENISGTEAVCTSEGNEPVCGLEEHSHDDSCYAEDKEILTCGQEEEEGHSHDEGCYTTSKTLTCELDEGEEHGHSEDCYITSTILDCGQSETEGHSHSEDCYEIVRGELVCGQDEHIHTDACYEDAAEGADQIPNDEKNPPETVDSTEESDTAHQHDDSCYQIIRKFLTCGKEGIHVHGDDCYQDSVLVCEAPIVESLEEHQHGTECFKDSTDDAVTRTFRNDDFLVTVVYNKTTNIPENAKLIVEEVTEEEKLADCRQRFEEAGGSLEDGEELTALLRMGFYTDDEVFVPEEKVHITVELLNGSICPEKGEINAACFTADSVELISGIDGVFTIEVEKLPELAFIAAEEKEGARLLTYEGEDYIVSIASGAGADIPENAQLVVEKSTKESNPSHYEKRLAEMEETEGAMTEEETITMLLDMRILAEDKEIPLGAAADVTVRFLNNDIYFEGDRVKAAHFAESGIRLVSPTDVDQENAITFQTDELGEYAFITAADIRTMTCEGEDFVVTVRFGQMAKIPDDAVLRAERITQESDSERFAEYENKIDEQMEKEERIALDMLMEIGFYVDEEEIEPQDVVDVKIKLLDREGLTGDDSIRVVHFAEHGVEVLKNTDVEEDGSSVSTAFQVDSFSVFGLGRNADGKIKDAKSFYDAITNAENDEEIVLDGSFDFPGEYQVTTPELTASNVTLNLNGYTISLKSENAAADDITLVCVKGNGASLTVVDKNDGTYNADEKTLVSYQKTEVSVSDPSIGRTSVTSHDYSVSGGAILGGENNSKAVFSVEGGILTIAGGIMAGNGGRVVEASQNATIKLQGGYLLNNSSLDKKMCGGAVYCNDSTIVIGGEDDGVPVLSGNRGDKGGAIEAENNSTVTMTGGYITNNRSENSLAGIPGGNAWDGGGIRVDDSVLTVSGGYITGNTAKGVGGGIFVNGGMLRLEGGYVSGNTAEENEGGGIAIYCKATAYIGDQNGQQKVFITDNQSRTVQDWGGGGMFINQDATVYLYNTLITNNTAKGFGGGVGGCATGRITEVDPLHGAAVFDNGADGQAYAGSNSVKHQDAEYTDPAKNPAFWERGEGGKYLFEDYFSALYSNIANDMLGDGSENWDGSIDGVRINRAAGSWKSAYIAGLTAYPSLEDKTKAINNARVYFCGNSSATHGGAIMCNGILVMGSFGSTPEDIEVPSRIELRATKSLQDGEGNSLNVKAGQFGFTVYSDEACTIPVTRGKNDADGKIAFDFLTFNLERATTSDPSYDTASNAHKFCYYIKEDPLSEESDNLGIVADKTVYCLTVFVRKTDHGIENNVHIYRDDIVRIKLEKGKVENGTYSSDETVYEDTGDNIQLNWGYSKYSDETHPIVISLTQEGIMKITWEGNDEPCESFDQLDANSFVNTRVGTTGIKVEKRWSDDVALEQGAWVKVSLYQNDSLFEAAGEITLNAESEWKGEWNDLTAADDNGQPYRYTVKENATNVGKLTDYDVAYDYKTDNGTAEVIITNTQKKLRLNLTKKNEEGVPLARAGFEISKNGKTLMFVQNKGEYILCEEDDAVSEESGSVQPEVFTTLYTGADGKINISGLRKGTYILTEVKAPFGYTEVKPHTIILNDNEDGDVVVSSGADKKPDFEVADDGYTLLLTLVDLTKTYVLPETGGIGTTVFYVIGSMMVLGSGILLITRKRMSGRERKHG